MGPLGTEPSANLGVMTASRPPLVQQVALAGSSAVPSFYPGETRHLEVERAWWTIQADGRGLRTVRVDGGIGDEDWHLGNRYCLPWGLYESVEKQRGRW